MSRLDIVLMFGYIITITGAGTVQDKKNGDDIRNSINQITEQLNDLQKENRLLKSQVSDLQAEVSTLQTKDEQNCDKIIRQKCNQFYKRKNKTKNPLIPITTTKGYYNVSFTAYPLQTHTYAVEGEVILFEGVLSNYEDAFNPNISVFQAPVNGFYQFFINVFSDYGFTFAAEIYLEGTGPLVSVITGPQNYGSASNTVIIHMLENQIVWVRSSCIYGNSCRLEADDNNRSTFTGLLLHTDNS